MSAAVGADIESLCNKCGDVWHVVVAMVGSSVAKVQCKQCGGYHRHRPPGGKGGMAKATPRRRSTKAAADVAPMPTVQIDPNAPVRPYNMRESFTVGDHIAHPRFGVGVVENATEPGKIAVWFPDGRRVLAVAKAESTLAVAAEHKPFAD